MNPRSQAEFFFTIRRMRARTSASSFGLPGVFGFDRKRQNKAKASAMPPLACMEPRPGYRQTINRGCQQRQTHDEEVGSQDGWGGKSLCQFLCHFFCRTWMTMTLLAIILVIAGES
jgi:hypothetical protein